MHIHRNVHRHRSRSCVVVYPLLQKRLVHADYTATPYKNVQYNADYTARQLPEARVKKRSQTPKRSLTPLDTKKESDTANIW